MSPLAWTMLVALITVLGTALLSLVNLRRYRRTQPPAPAVDSQAPINPPHLPHVSVCIPARNEEANIEACARSLLAQDCPRLEVLVYDDQSTDQTPAILHRLAAEDPRLRVVPSHPLPPGWNGKQHACWRMGQFAASHPPAQSEPRPASPPASPPEAWLLFTDADVRFEPACVRRALEQAVARRVALLSTFPRQIVGSPGEALLVPMIFFLLFSYLPMARMRRTRDPAASAGCGQFLLVRADAYHAVGGHSAFKDSMHDGIKMPRALRRAGLATDLFDATDLCSVRMYRGWRATWRGFAKNAYEGLGSLGLLLFLTALHAIAHVLPWLVVATALVGLVVPRVPTGILGPLDPPAALLALLTVVAALTQRIVLARAFRHPLWIAPLHPLGVLLMTLVQWHSFVLHVTGRRAWRGRVQGNPTTALRG